MSGHNFDMFELRAVHDREGNVFFIGAHGGLLGDYFLNPGF